MAENEKLRKMLWLTHYNHMKHLYGDDGEMQCHECRIDFKRDNVEDIEKALLRYVMIQHEKEKTK